MLVAMSLAGGFVTLPFAIRRRLRPDTGNPEIPYGVAIAMAGLLTLREPIINQFG
jgi:prepilin peptidase CpaA